MLKKSLAILIFLFAAGSARAQSDDSGEDAAATKAISPYFYVAGGDPDTDRLPLKSLSADLRITGAIAAVKVNQVFENRASKPIEAVYVFSASTRAAVHGMRMHIGNRLIEARIDRKKKAREDYEAAKKEGKRASLLEQHRPNVFSMSVANVMPGDRIAVELAYSELLVPESSVYELVFPAVVGSALHGGADAKQDGWMATPYLKEGSPETYAYSVTAHLHTGVPFRKSRHRRTRSSSPSRAQAAPTCASKIPAAATRTSPCATNWRAARCRPASCFRRRRRQARTARDFALMMEPPAA